jgi:hypothetical protein
MASRTSKVALLLRTKPDSADFSFTLPLTTDIWACDGDLMDPGVNFRFAEKIRKFRSSNAADLLIVPVRIMADNKYHICILVVTHDDAELYDPNGASNTAQQTLPSLSGMLSLTIYETPVSVNLQAHEESAGDVVGGSKTCAAWCLAVIEEMLSNDMSVSDAVEQLSEKASTPKKARKFIQKYADKLMKKHKKCKDFGKPCENVRI